MASNWESLLFDTCELGVSSAIAPELLPPNQVAWGQNIDVRGGKPATRPNLAYRLALPSGLIQGAEYFSVQGGMLVASIAGRICRIRINGNVFSSEEIPLDFVNSPIIKRVWMTQTVETLVIQDGQSDPILYNGSVAPRSTGTQVPRGRQMGYGNGRLWVAVNEHEALAGDIRQSAAGSELQFTEGTYLTGGGKLFFTRPITGMAFIPVTGQSDYGALLVFGAGQTNAIRADITSRDDWGRIPGFETAILRSVGAASQWSIVSVNQDLYWRDSNGGIRSIRNALADEAGPGSAPISREVSRLTDFDSERQLGFCSGVYFDNRLLMTSSPFLLPNGGVGWKDIIPLDYAPLSTMGGKSQAAYDGQWSGLNFVKLVGGEIGGQNRAFALVTDDEGANQLWEFDSGNRADLIIACADGTGDPGSYEFPIACYVEYPQRDFGQPKRRKRLDRCDVWLSQVDGPLNLKVEWRPDNSQKWLEWDEADTCAQTTDTSVAVPHVWKNLLSQYRPQFKTFTIPDSIVQQVGYDARVGFEFQIRLSWTGRCLIDKVMVHGAVLTDPDFANRETFYAQCIENDVTGNEVLYRIPQDSCPVLALALGDTGFSCGGVITSNSEAGATVNRTFTVTNSGVEDLVLGTVAVTGAGFAVITQPGQTTLERGESTTFVIRFTPPGSTGGTGVVTLPSNAPDSPCEFDFVVAVPLVDLTCISEAGFATLCGISEYTTPSVPPKKYRVQTIAGTITSCVYVGTSTCAEGFNVNSKKDIWSGTYVYNPATCAVVNTQNWANWSTGGPVMDTPRCQGPLTIFRSNNVLGLGESPRVYNEYPPSFIATITPTSKSWVGTGVCDDGGVGGGSATSVLSSEDTEDDAIARVVGTPGTACMATRETRGAGDFNFNFVAVTFSLNCSDLVAGLSYTVTVDKVTENYGGGSPVTTQQQFVFTAVATTHLISTPLACANGKQVTVQNPVIAVNA